MKSRVEEIPAYLLHHRVPKVIGDDIVFLISFYTISTVSNKLVYTHRNDIVNAQESIVLRQRLYALLSSKKFYCIIHNIQGTVTQCQY